MQADFLQGRGGHQRGARRPGSDALSRALRTGRIRVSGLASSAQVRQQPYFNRLLAGERPTGGNFHSGGSGADYPGPVAVFAAYYFGVDTSSPLPLGQRGRGRGPELSEYVQAISLVVAYRADGRGQARLLPSPNWGEG